MRMVKVDRLITIRQSYTLPVEGEDNAYVNMTEQEIKAMEETLEFGELVENGGFYTEEKEGNVQMVTEVKFFDTVEDEEDPDKDYDLVKENALHEEDEWDDYGGTHTIPGDVKQDENDYVPWDRA
jgi:hypothetical protein